MPRQIHSLVVIDEDDGNVDTPDWVPDGPVELKQTDETLTEYAGLGLVYDE
jgi:hypothetical protein